jgi:hypothetical protein
MSVVIVVLFAFMCMMMFIAFMLLVSLMILVMFMRLIFVMIMRCWSVVMLRGRVIIFLGVIRRLRYASVRGVTIVRCSSFISATA